MSRAMINTIVTIALSLLVMFRRPAGAVLPLVIVGLSLLTTLGLMAALNIAIKVSTQILPTFIFVTGVADSIHILTLYFRCIDNSGDRPAALEAALSHAGLPVLLTSLTTAAGCSPLPQPM